MFSQFFNGLLRVRILSNQYFIIFLSILSMSWFTAKTVEWTNGNMGRKESSRVFQHFCQLLIISYYNIDRWEEKQQKGNESHGATLVPLNSWTRSTKELEISRNGGESNNRVMYWSVKSWPDSVVIAREKGRKNRSGQQIPSIVPSALVRGNCLKSAQFISSQSQKFF